MTKKKFASTRRTSETDGQYLLKLIVIIILGSVWLRWHQGLLVNNMPLPPIPIGMMIGLLMVHRFERYSTDRRIWFFVLIISAMISLFLPTGIII